MTPPPLDGSSYRFLSDVIMARGLVEPGAMKAALQASLAGRGLSEILVERGAISELDLARTVAEHHRLDHVDLDVFAVDDEALTVIDPAVMRRLGAVPIAILSSGALVVAIHDPNGSPAVREISQLVDRTIQPAVASRPQVEALIESLRACGHPLAPPPSAPTVVAAAPEKHLRSVPAGDVVISSAHPVDVLRPTATSPTLMDTRNHNDQRAREAQELSRIAEGRARAADERLAHEQQRAAEAEERASKAENMIAAANSRAEGLMAAATAANEALARLVGNCEVLEREGREREGQLLALRSELESERGERVRLETALRDPQPGDELLALHIRIAELKRELAEERAPAQPPAPAQAQAQAVLPPPPAEPVAAAPPPVNKVAAAPPPVKKVAVAPPPVNKVAAAPPPVKKVAVAPPPVNKVAAAPPPVNKVAAAPPAAQEPAVAHHEPAPSALTIDIVGEPGVPYVSALAPMPPVADRVKPAKNAKSAVKARGLRRLIGALKRG